MARPVGSLLLLSVALLACESERRDPDDLRGVFDRPSASASTAPSATAARAAPPPASAEPTVPAIPSRRRQPIEGPCIAASGEPAEPARRSARRPACSRSEILESRDAGGVPRYACIFAPTNLERRTPLPLVVFFHDEHRTPAMVQRSTGLRRLNDELDLTGDPARRGFIVLAPQARRIGHLLAFDTEHVARDNPDVATTDGFVDELVKRGWVDPRQIYAIGASRGGEMAAMWAMLRPDRVAGFAAYGSDASRLRWSCREPQPPAAVVYRACDTVTRCADVEKWLLSREDAHAPTLGLRLGAANKTEPSCALSKTKCRDTAGRANHARWPRGREGEILEYLGRFSLHLPEPRR